MWTWLFTTFQEMDGCGIKGSLAECVSNFTRNHKTNSQRICSLLLVPVMPEYLQNILILFSFLSEFPHDIK